MLAEAQSCDTDVSDAAEQAEVRRRDAAVMDHLALLASCCACVKSMIEHQPSPR
jgi:hypothetical protein